MALPIRRKPFPPQSVSPIRKLPQPSYPSPSEGRQTENHSHRKLTNVITQTTALSNSVKLWVMPFRVTQDGWVMVKSSDKTWSTGERNGKLLQYSCLETLCTVWTGKRIGQWKMNSPVGTCPIRYRDQWRNNSRKNEEREPAKTTPSCGCDRWWK